MANLEDIVKKPKVYGDGTNGSPVSQLPVMAAQNLATAAQLPTTVAAPIGGASQIPGTTPYEYVPPPVSTQISDGLNNLGAGIVNRVLPAVGGPAAAMAGEAAGFRALGAINRANAANNVARVAPPGAVPASNAVATAGAPANVPAVPGLAVTEGANLAGVGTQVPAAQQAANSLATAQRLGTVPTGVPPVQQAGNLAPVVANTTTLPTTVASNAGNTLAKVGLGTAAAGGVAGTGAYIAGAPSGDGTPTSISPIDPATGQPRRTMDNAVPKTLASVAPGGDVPATNANGAAAPDTPNTTSADRIAQMERDATAIQDLTQRRLAQEQFNGGMGSGVMDQLAPEAAARQKFFDEANLRNAANKGSWSPRGGYQGDKGAVAAAMVPIENRAKAENVAAQVAGHERVATATNLAAERRDAARDATLRRGQDIGARTNTLRDALTLRSQDITAQGHALDAKAKADKLNYEMMKDDREFQLRSATSGVETAEKEWKQRNDAQDKVVERAASMLPPTADGKPDKAGAARMAQAVQARYTKDVLDLEAAVAKDPTNKEFATALDKLKRNGLRNYSVTDQEEIIKGAYAAEMAARAQEAGPLTRWWEGTRGGTISDLPVQGLKKVTQTVGPDVYVEVGPDGKPLKGGRRVPASAVEGENRNRRNLQNIIQP